VWLGTLKVGEQVRHGDMAIRSSLCLLLYGDAAGRPFHTLLILQITTVCLLPQTSPSDSLPPSTRPLLFAAVFDYFSSPRT
jgi:hypothetical protein